MTSPAKRLPGEGGRPAVAIRHVLMAGGVLAVISLFWGTVEKAPVAITPNAAEDELWMDRKGEEARVRDLVSAAGKPERGRQTISFSDLVFSVTPEQAQQGEKEGYAKWLPASVKALNGRKVRLQGFMLPMRVQEGKVTECLIMANQLSCCYGQPPRFCEFITAKVTGRPVPLVQDRLLVFDGTLRIADVFEGNVWAGLYTLELDSMGR